MNLVLTQIASRMEKDGYKPINISVPGIVMLAGSKNGMTNLIGLIDCSMGIPCDGATLYSIGSNLSSLYNTGNILFIAFTRDSYNTRLFLQGNTLWIYNETTSNLEIYDNRPTQYFNVDKYIYEKASTKTVSVSKIFNFNNLFILINVIIFIIMESDGDTKNAYYLYMKGGAMADSVIGFREYYRLFTSMFMHAGFSHIIGNMAVLFFIGDNLERAVGHIKYIAIYILSGLLSGLATMIYYNAVGKTFTVCVGASGAIFGVVGALIYILIKNKGQLEDLTLPAIGIFTAYNIYAGFKNTGVCMPAHISGLIVGFVLAAILYRKRGLAYED